MKKFIFPGSFDPFTNGHKAIVDQTYKLCDEFIIALATNLKKGEGLIKRSERVKLIKEIFKDYPNVTVIDMTDTLISDYCKKDNLKIEFGRKGWDKHRGDDSTTCFYMTTNNKYLIEEITNFILKDRDNLRILKKNNYE